MEDSVELPPRGEDKKEGEKYRKVKVLGQGAMGRAYLVESADDGQLYVMKRINIGHLGPKQKDNALREAQLHSLFTHPNIVQLKEVYQTTGQKICIIMEYAESGDLEEFLQAQEGKLLNEQTVLSMFSQMCLGLQEVHAKRIIHRDIKTANIFRNKDNSLKIGDFGISKSLDKTSLAATSMLGTPYYLSPEMVEGKPYSTKADIWALGVILYQLCTLKLPFEANSLPVLALKILKGSFPPIPGQYSKDIKALLLQMLNTDQKKRPSVETILLKPFINKHLPKSQQLKLVDKQEQKKNAVKEKEKKDLEKKVQAVDKEKEQKIRAKKEKQDKRQEMRRQMRQDLKKKRAEKDKEAENGGTSLAVPEQRAPLKKSPAKVSSKDISQTPKPQSVKQIPSKQQKKQEPVKPWKTKKALEKKDITIEMYVPEVKPKSQIKPMETFPSGSDFNVEIYVANRPQQRYHSEQEEVKPQARKSLPIIESVENYHYSEKRIGDETDDIEEEISQEQSDEEYQTSQYDKNEVMNNLRRVAELTKDLPDPSKSVCLYEESDNFDSTVQVSPQPRAQQVDNLKHLLNSESLEQLRLILEDKLGDQKFISAYSVVKQHLDEYYEMLMEHEEQIDRQTLRQKYVFNKQYLREKLPKLSDDQFYGNIELLYTLIMYEDLQMQKNQKKQFGANESKYAKLF